MLSESERAELANGQLRLVCPRLEITAAHPEIQTTYSGPGEIVAGRGVPTRFTIDAGANHPLPMVFPRWPAGKRHQLKDLPVLQATDRMGRHWTGVAEVQSLFDSPAHGRVHRLAAEQVAASSSPALRILVGGEVSLPVQVWRLRDEGRFVTMRSVSDCVEIVVQSEADLSPTYYMRLEEALWLTTGGLVSANLTERRVSNSVITEVLTSLPATRRGLFGIPLKPFPHNSHFWGDMFLRYLHYVSAAPEGRFHPTSADLRIIFAAADATIEQAALAAAVALEAFVRREHLDLGFESAETLEEIEKVRVAISSLALSGRMKRRLKGALKSMASQSVRSALEKLSIGGPITAAHVMAWEDVRHRFAHGLSRPREEWDEVMSKTQLVFQALTFLILNRIGYEGPVADITTLGWPAIQFPSK